MINKKYTEAYCKEYWNIENYDKAIADKTLTWHCHHRREITECKSTKQLMEIGEYYDRPACELIFLTHAEHRRLHNNGEKNPFFGKHHSEVAKKKISEAHKGKPRSEDIKKKLSVSVLQYTKSGEFIREWYGMSEVERELGIAHSSIAACCRGKLKSAGNFIWRKKDA